MTDSGEQREDFKRQVLERVANIVSVLASVRSGDFRTRSQSDLEETHPMGALCLGVNQTIDSLAAAQERTSAYQRDLEEKLNTIQRQQVAIKELSTPVIEMWEGVLCLPIVGIVDSARNAEMTEALLHAITQKKARCAIIDITGMDVMDSGAADHFTRMAKAVGLLGAQCYLSGISPNLAETIVRMGLDLSGVTTHRNLRAALQAWVRFTLEESAEPEAAPNHKRPNLAER
jgi:rsbT co-antagonist protein RsbR